MTASQFRARQLLARGGMEVVWAILCLPYTVIVFLFFFWPWTLPLLAEWSRFLARIFGADAPSGRGDRKYGPWLASRVTEIDFWRSDVPTVIVTALLNVVSFVIGFLGLVAAGAFMTMPFLASTSRPIMFFDSDGERAFTSLAQIWWLIPVGLAVLALTLIVLALVDTGRLHLVAALSRDPRARQVQQLAGEIRGLRHGRATLVDAFESERTRIERDLHDGAQQRMLAVTMLLGAASQKTTPETEVYALIEQAQIHAQASLRELRETVRGIHPAVLTDLGLAAALKDLCAHSPLSVDLRITGEGDPSAPVSTALYFAVSELLTNISRHAEVTTAIVKLSMGKDTVTVNVIDEGAGGAAMDPQKTTGLAALAERLEVVGAVMRIESPIGKGTSVQICAPRVPPW